MIGELEDGTVTPTKTQVGTVTQVVDEAVESLEIGIAQVASSSTMHLALLALSAAFQKMLQGVTSLAPVVVAEAVAAGLVIGIVLVVHLPTMHTVGSAIDARSQKREVVDVLGTGNAAIANFSTLLHEASA